MENELLDNSHDTELRNNTEICTKKQVHVLA